MGTIRTQQVNKSKKAKDKAVQNKINAATVLGLTETHDLIIANADAILLLQEAVNRLENILVKEET